MTLTVSSKYFFFWPNDNINLVHIIVILQQHNRESLPIPYPRTSSHSQHLIGTSSQIKLTKGILEALSFHTAISPKDAKNPNPPHSQANASY